MKSDYMMMKESLDMDKKIGGVVPPGVAQSFYALDQAFVAGNNFDAAFKSACQEMGNFLVWDAHQMAGRSIQVGGQAKKGMSAARLPGYLNGRTRDRRTVSAEPA